MPNRVVTRRDAEPVEYAPFGLGGVDMFTEPSLLPPEVMALAENTHSTDLGLSRRPGSAKLARLTDTGGSKTFGATTKYALLTAASQLLLPKGGFAFKCSFVATRPSGGNTAWIVSSRPNGQTYHVFKVTLSDAGVITATFRDTGGSDRTTSTAAVDAGATVHFLVVLDVVAGTWTAYVNGQASGTPLTGLSSSIQPIQTASVAWAFGVEKETGVAVTANSNFDGALDAITLFTLSGLRPSTGTTTVVDMLRAHSARQWPSPEMDMVVFNYDCDSTSTTVLYDSSRFANNASLVGTPSNTSAVAYNSPVGNYVGYFDQPDGGAYNLAAAYGTLYYEQVRRSA